MPLSGVKPRVSFPLMTPLKKVHVADIDSTRFISEKIIVILKLI